MNHMKTPLHFNYLHIFRAILRETTYLPDPKVRFHLRHWVRDSFRAEKIKFVIHRQSWTQADRRKREVALMARARGFCTSLRRANDGYLEAFRRTLLLTYARTGDRRRQLMYQIMNPSSEPQPRSATDEKAEADANDLDEQPLPASLDGAALDPPPSADGLNALTATDLSATRFFSDDATATPTSAEPTETQVVRTPTHFGRPAKAVPPLFTALSASQSTTSSYIPSQTRMNQSNGPKLPATTIWQQPLPACRVRNLTAKWYAKEAALLVPPLPLEEWTHIRAIASGTAHLPVPERRVAAKTPVFCSALEPAEQAVSLLARPEREVRYEGKKRGNPHQITPRFLRRQYEWLLRHSPVQIEAPQTPAPAPAVVESEVRTAQAEKSESSDEVNKSTTWLEAAKRNSADKPPAILWHSTILERTGRRVLRTESLGAKARKALFD